IETFCHGLDRKVAAGGMEHLRLRGRNAERDEPDRARHCPQPHAKRHDAISPARIVAPDPPRAMLPRIAATTMRCRRCSGKVLTVHFGVTAILTFRLDAPRGMSAIGFGRKGRGIPMRIMTSVVAAVAVALGCVTVAHAQAYPSRPITIIVPFPAGG